MIETTYSVSESEFLEASRLWCPEVVKKLPGYVSSQIALGLAGGCAVLCLPYVPYWLGTALVLSVVALVLLGHWRKKAIRQDQYKLISENMQNVSVRFDDEGYHDHKDGRGSTWIAWKTFTGWRETSTIFILGFNQHFLTMPKSSLSVDQQNTLRTLLQEHIVSSLPPTDVSS